MFTPTPENPISGTERRKLEAEAALENLLNSMAEENRVQEILGNLRYSDDARQDTNKLIRGLNKSLADSKRSLAENRQSMITGYQRRIAGEREMDEYRDEIEDILLEDTEFLIALKAKLNEL